MERISPGWCGAPKDGGGLLSVEREHPRMERGLPRVERGYPRTERGLPRVEWRLPRVGRGSPV